MDLIVQGLTDQSEWIIAKALRATCSLAELGLLPKQALCDLVAESAVYLAHPNLWVSDVNYQFINVNIIDLVLIDQQSVEKRNLHLMDTVNAKKRWATSYWRALLKSEHNF
jgi:hypothetical protein